MCLSGGFSNATASGSGVDYGDYVGLDAYGGKLYTVWADNANCDGTNPNGTLHQFDLYTNTIVFGGPTPTPHTNGYSYGDRNTYAYTHPDSNTYSNANSDTNANTASHSYSTAPPDTGAALVGRANWTHGRPNS
jgi:hypothetical protein